MITIENLYEINVSNFKRGDKFIFIRRGIPNDEWNESVNWEWTYCFEVWEKSTELSTWLVINRDNPEKEFVSGYWVCEVGKNRPVEVSRVFIMETATLQSLDKVRAMLIQKCLGNLYLNRI